MTRALHWDGCVNVRDLGGVPLEEGGETRFGALVRADNVRKLSDAGWEALAAHGVTRIVDLRWSEELAQDAPRDVEIDVVHLSVLGRLDEEYVDDVDDYLERDDAAGYWASFYEEMLERYRANFGAAVTALADAPEGVALFHCAGGKDRTGLVAALVLRTAGVGIDDIAADYALTGANLTSGWVDDACDEAERRRRLFKQQTPGEAVARTLRTLEERYGDVESYLRAAGVTGDQLERLRARLAAP
ncbi:MAG: tyrosine-protein phosphatase [Gaiellaceae bacterium]